MKNFKRNVDGITLIALVVTIVVLLILTGVSITAVFGDNGLINKAEKAKEIYEESSKKEEDILLDALDSVNLITIKPQVSSGMTKIKWDSEKQKWKRVEGNEEWYNYSASKKQWANVVMGNNEIFDDQGYLKEEDGDDKSTYIQLVWIPRYAYKITSGYHSNETGTIEVVFINTDNKGADGTQYSTTYPNVTENAMDNYVVHPSFDFGDKKLPGFWVGKFEASHSECTTDYTTGETNNDIENKTMTVKPNVTSWRNLIVGDMFTACQNLKTNDSSTYNFSNTDPHLMKNTEWGAVAYLSKSRYGKENEEVWINNNSSYITGRAGNSANEKNENTGTYDIPKGDETKGQNAYNTANGQKASTTGNVYGVYDMNGGSSEYVAAYVNTGNQSLSSMGQSLTEESTGSEYKDVYEATAQDGTSDTREGDYNLANPLYDNGHYGDAVYETSNHYRYNGKSWFNDLSYMPGQYYGIFCRGGSSYDGDAGGVFYFGDQSGTTFVAISFRPVVIVS